MKFNFAKSLVAAAALALTAVAAQAANVGTVVTIQEGAIAGTPSNVISADQLSGQYNEIFTATSAVTSGSTTTGGFVTEAIFNAGNWFLNNVAQSSYLNSAGSNGYGIYVKFSSIGNYTTINGVTSFVTTSGVVQVFADANHDTVYDIKNSATGNVNNLNLVSAASTLSDDVLLGTATTLLAGNGAANAGGLSNGNFELLFASFDLSNPDGLSYFIAPRPFNLQLDLNGNFQSFNPLTQTSIALTNNSANAFFKPVPEPSALALAGIALVGAAVATRRKNRKA